MALAFPLRLHLVPFAAFFAMYRIARFSRSDAGDVAVADSRTNTGSGRHVTVMGFCRCAAGFLKSTASAAADSYPCRS